MVGDYTRQGTDTYSSDMAMTRLQSEQLHQEVMGRLIAIREIIVRFRGCALTSRTS